MNRLPKRFEEEVLAKHGIYWDEKYTHCTDGICWTTGDKYLKSFTVPVSEYEIAGIALEAMGEFMILCSEYEYKGCYQVRMIVDGDDCFSSVISEDKDFCTCIFKAVEEIWE